MPSLWELLSLRTLGCAAALMLLSVGWNYDSFGHDWTQQFVMADTLLETLLQP